MMQTGFVIDDKTDENERIKQKYHALRHENEYEIMILPTYQCNLRCWYCIQEHQDNWIDDETINRIKLLVKSKLSDEEIKHLSISWFGGEPLLSYDKVLEVTQWASEYCKSIGKSFSSFITTNGTLLTEKRIDELREAGIKHYQITIDGKRDKHDTIKVLGKISAFDKVMENINQIIRHTSCTLRLNYTRDNMDPEAIIKDVDSHLSVENRDNLQFLIYKVWQEANDSVPQEEVEKLSTLSKSIGIRPKLMETGLCYVDYKHFDCIYPNGKVGKCDNGDPEQGQGRLCENGEIEWNGDIRSHRAIMDVEESECSSCRYLPICWGPCSAKREIMYGRINTIRCHYSDRNNEMAQLIRNAFVNKEYMHTCEN